MRGNQRILLIVAAVAVAIVAFVIINPGGDDDNASTTPTTSTAAQAPATTTEDAGPETTTETAPAEEPEDNVTTATVRVVNAKPQGGIETITAKKNDRLRLTVVSDTADEIHVHGYDISRDVEAGGTAKFDFKLTIDGIFEIELESRGEQIAKLVVEP